MDCKGRNDLYIYVFPLTRKQMFEVWESLFFRYTETFIFGLFESHCKVIIIPVYVPIYPEVT